MLQEIIQLKYSGGIRVDVASRKLEENARATVLSTPYLWALLYIAEHFSGRSIKWYTKRVTLPNETVVRSFDLLVELGYILKRVGPFGNYIGITPRGHSFVHSVVNFDNINKAMTKQLWVSWFSPISMRKTPGRYNLEGFKPYGVGKSERVFLKYEGYGRSEPGLMGRRFGEVNSWRMRGKSQVAFFQLKSSAKKKAGEGRKGCGIAAETNFASVPTSLIAAMNKSRSASYPV